MTHDEMQRWIDEFERELFPHQESEFEQESFTPEGRKRVAAVLQKLIPSAEACAVCAGPVVDALDHQSCLVGRRNAAVCGPCRAEIAALRAPAVTSPEADALVEAQHRAERAEGRLREISDLLEDAGVPGGTTIYGGVMMLRERAERAESSLCAPAAGAPPALVALVQRWQKARLAVRDAEDHEAYSMAEQLLDIHERALLSWSRPSGPAEPVEAMPEIRVGDVVVRGGRLEPPRFQQVTTDYESRKWQSDTGISAVFRRIWRRPEGQ